MPTHLQRVELLLLRRRRSSRGSATMRTRATILGLLIDASLHGAAEALYNLRHLGRGPKISGQRRATYGRGSVAWTLRHGAALRAIVGRIVGALLQKITGRFASNAIFALGATPAMSQIVKEAVGFLQHAHAAANAAAAADAADTADTARCADKLLRGGALGTLR